MALEIMRDDVKIIQGLSDYPNQEEGLSAQEMKAKFDEAAVKLQGFINDSVVPAVNGKLDTAALDQAVSDAVDQALQNFSPEKIGAAPAGYGYGGQAVALKGNSIITSEEELNTELAKVYDSMASGETKMITWIQYPLSSDWRWFGMLSKSSANNGSLTAHSAYGGGSNIIKTKNSGIWRTVEWENPPMLPGTEYRTTERWDNKPVYRKLVKHTNEAVISGGTLYQIEHGISNMDRNYGVQISARTVGYQLPYLATGESTAVTSCTATKIEMWATGATSWSAGRTWYFDMKYVKSE